MSILIASDHAGVELKEQLIKMMPEFGWKDLGPSDKTSVDYPDYADRVASEVAKHPHNVRGVLICGSGQGMCMRANRFEGVRAALVYNDEVAKITRQHNDANIICLGARGITPEQAANWIRIFLQEPFEGGRHQGRVAKIDRATN